MDPADVPAWFAARGLQCSATPALREVLTFEPVVRFFGSPSIGTVRIGAFSYLAPHVVFNRGSIGRYSSIGDRSTFGPTQHPNDWLTTSPIAYKSVFDGTAPPMDAPSHEELAEVHVGNDVWIGANSAIMGGVTIGDGAIVAYGSVVTKDVPPYAIVGGTPARLIRMRFPDMTIEALRASRWWRYDLVRMRGPSIPWQDPLAALEAIIERAAGGDIDLMGETLHRIARQGASSFGFTKLR